MCHARGPGTSASGCQGESRYAAVAAHAVSVYVLATPSEVATACAAKVALRRSAVYRAPKARMYKPAAVSPATGRLLRRAHVPWSDGHQRL